MTENSEQLNAQAVDDESVTASPPVESSASPVTESPSADTSRADSPVAVPMRHDTASSDEGWVMSSDSPAEEPASVEGVGTTDATHGRGSRGQKATRITLGSTLIALDAVGERLDRLDDPDIEQIASPRSLDDVLVPMSEWQEQFGVMADQPTRHLMLGMMVDAKARAGATARFINGIGNSVAEAINFLLKPVRTRRVFRPVRHGFGKAVERGDSQIERWRAMGRAEDARSRALAETAISDAAEETMDELVSNERVEVFIQEVIESQTVGIVDEIIEEIRERAVSSDNFFERLFVACFAGPIARKYLSPTLIRDWFVLLCVEISRFLRDLCLDTTPVSSAVCWLSSLMWVSS